MHEQDLKFFYGMLFGRRENKHTMMIFFIPSSNLGSVPKDSTPVKFSYSFAVFKKLEKTQKFEKTRIRLKSDIFATLAINILKHPTFMNVTLSFWFYRKHLWSKEESIMIRWKNCLLNKKLRN